MATKTIGELAHDLDDASTAYFSGVETLPSGPDLKKLSDRVKDLKTQISATIASGAKPCPDCQRAPIGMRKTQATAKAPEIYEVGCLNCQDHRARGTTPELAVQHWNMGPVGWVPTEK